MSDYTTTIFLRAPAGVAIKTNLDANEASNALYLDTLTVVNERGATVHIPTENIASIEQRS